MSAKHRSGLSRRHGRHARQRREQHQQACQRARKTLEDSGWDVRQSGVGGLLIAHRPGQNPDGPTLYGSDPLELLQKTIKLEESAR